RRHTRWPRDWSSDVCSSDLLVDAHEPDDLAILGDRANGSADVGAFEKEIQHRRSRERDAESEQARVADIDAADLEHRQPHSDVRSEERRVGKEGRYRVAWEW